MALGLLFVAGYVNGAEADGAGAARKWLFKVYLNDKPIGFHDFRIEETADRQVLSTQAEFDVKLLFITAFSYRHENTETWQGDCLVEIDARTDNNGEELIVAGERRDDRFSLRTAAGADELEGCVQTFAYWNPAILEADRLLNSQTGEYEDIEVAYSGSDTIRVGDRDVVAERYTLTAKGGDIKLWYSADDRRWLALEAPAKGGRSIRYEPIAVPDTAAPTRLARNG
jgi:hypothetical protein